jgi:hypothetical protein
MVAWTGRRRLPISDDNALVEPELSRVRLPLVLRAQTVWLCWPIAPPARPERFPADEFQLAVYGDSRAFTVNSKDMRLNLAVCVTFLSLCTSVTAATISLDPLSGSVDGQPGQPAGWGFTILNDSPVNWISFTNSLLIGETNPSVGGYVDFIGAQGGPVGFALPPLMTWIEAFSDPSQTGVGEFMIDPNAPAGALDSGSIRVTWEQFSNDPAICDCIPAAFSADLPFQVSVDSGAPEPGTVWLTVIGGALWLIGRQRYTSLRLS